GRGGVRVGSRRPCSAEVLMRVIGLAVVLALGLVIASLAAEAQQPLGRARVGVLSSSSPERERTYLASFEQSLCDLGYSQGKNLVIDRRYAAAGKFESLPGLAAEFTMIRTYAAHERISAQRRSLPQ